MQQTHDRFGCLFGRARGGESPPRWLASLAGDWQAAHERFRDAWDRTEEVPAAEFLAASEGAIAALGALRREDAGFVIAWREVNFIDVVAGVSTDVHYYEASLADVDIGALWPPRTDGTTPGRSEYALSPCDLLRFAGEEETMLVGIGTGTVTDMQRSAGQELTRRLQQRLQVGARDLLSEEDVAALAASR